MPNFNAVAASAVATALLTGCASSSDRDQKSAPTPDYISFAAIEPDAVAMENAYLDLATGDLDAGITPADEADIPDSNSASYDGFISIPLDDGDLVGQLEMTVTFAATDGTIDSTAYGFFHRNNGAYTGNLTGTGTLGKSPAAGDPQIAASLTGDLSNGGTVYDTSVVLSGDIVANGADPYGAVAGIADGIVTWNGGADVDIFTDGLFAAER